MKLEEEEDQDETRIEKVVRKVKDNPEEKSSDPFLGY